MTTFSAKLRMDNPDKYPKRMGEKWTGEEEEEIIKLCSDGKSIEEISQIHKRTLKSIRCRIDKLIYNMNTSGASIEDICKTFNKHKTSVLKVIEKQLLKESKKKEKKSKIDDDIEERVDKLMRDDMKKPPKVVKSTVKPLLNTILEEQNAMKQEIKAIHSKLDELMTMMQAAFEFEDE